MYFPQHFLTSLVSRQTEKIEFETRLKFSESQVMEIFQLLLEFNNST